MYGRPTNTTIHPIGRFLPGTLLTAVTTVNMATAPVAVRRVVAPIVVVRTPTVAGSAPPETPSLRAVVVSARYPDSVFALRLALLFWGAFGRQQERGRAGGDVFDDPHAVRRGVLGRLRLA